MENFPDYILARRSGWHISKILTKDSDQGGKCLRLYQGKIAHHLVFSHFKLWSLRREEPMCISFKSIRNCLIFQRQPKSLSPRMLSWNQKKKWILWRFYFFEEAQTLTTTGSKTTALGERGNYVKFELLGPLNLPTTATSKVFAVEEGMNYITSDPIHPLCIGTAITESWGHIPRQRG